MRFRKSIQNNYAAIFQDGKTIRFKLDQSKDILPLQFPEILDLGINSICHSPACSSFCYVKANKFGYNFPNIVDKAIEIWGDLDDNLKPFQVAIGSSGEPLEAPDFIEFIKTINQLGIMPNYTTNSLCLNDKIIEASKQYCGGLAISLHPGLEKVWLKGIERTTEAGIKTCAHIIIGQHETDDERFWSLYKQLEKFNLEFFVILPFQKAGFAENDKADTNPVWKRLFKRLAKEKPQNIALGALFWDWINSEEENLDLCREIGFDLYPPEIFSGYIQFDQSYKMLRYSSYDQRVRHIYGSENSESLR